MSFLLRPANGGGFGRPGQMGVRGAMGEGVRTPIFRAALSRSQGRQRPRTATRRAQHHPRERRVSPRLLERCAFDLAGGLSFLPVRPVWKHGQSFGRRASISALSGQRRNRYLSHRDLRYYTSRLQYSRPLRYRIARLLATWLPLALFLYVLLFVVAARG
jgi:hypothetical protein